MLNWKVMRRLLEIVSIILIAGLLVLVTSCASGSGPAPVPSTTQMTAVKLVFTTQPGGGIAGSAFDIQPVVTAEDAEGNLVTGYRGMVNLTITANTGTPGARLFGGTTVLFSNGKVGFNELSVDKAGADYTLTASSSNLLSATSAPFSISPGKPAKLAFAVQPSGALAGSPFTPGPEVSVQDIYGNTVSYYEGSATLSATAAFPDTSDPNNNNPPVKNYPMALSGTTTVPFVDGIARFSDISCRVSMPKYSLTATNPSLGSVTSVLFTVQAGAPVQLAFTVQPSGCIAGQLFEKQPKVAIEDSCGNVVLTSRDSITVSIVPGSGTDGAVLSGTKTEITDDALGGLAEFTDLSMDLAGSGYMLVATTDDFPPATSEAFDVSAP